jgi:protein TonB
MTLAWSSDTAALVESRPARGDIGRWTASLLIVALLHAAGALVLMRWHATVEPVAPPPAAVMIDLAPAPPPVAVPQPPPQPEALKAAPPEPKVVPPKLAVVLPKPKPKPIPQRVEAPPQPEAPPVPAPPRPPEPLAAAPAPTPAPAPVPTVEPNYQGLLVAQLLRHKRYPREARMRHQEGVPTVRFSIDREGRLLAVKLERSSGIPTLDDEVVAMVQRAAPLPPFPASMTQAQLELIVPVRFELR